MKQLLTIAGMLLATTVVGTVGIHITAEKTWLESAYLAVITLTTLGSRDVPADGDMDAMLFVMAYLICGLGIFSYGAFQLGQSIVNAQLRGAWELRRMQRTIAKLDGHYIVCGLGRMGRAICEHLQSRQTPFVVIDRDETLLKRASESHGWLFVPGDATADRILVAAGIERATALATALSSDADNLFVVLSAHLLAPKLNIIARASDEGASVKMQRAGATRVISPIQSAGVKMARLMLSPRIEEFLEVADPLGGELELVEIQVHERGPYAGHRISETDLRTRGLLVAGIRRSAGDMQIAPPHETTMQTGDVLFVFGRKSAIGAILDDSPAN